MENLTNYRTLLSAARTIAVVGLSPKQDRPSNRVARYLLDHGYQVIPVNPRQEEILDLPCYPNLTSAARALTQSLATLKASEQSLEPGRPLQIGRIDIVDVFRRSDQVLPVVEEAIAVGARAVWMQEGVINHEAARKAEAAGLTVIMDQCIKIVHAKLLAHASLFGPP